MVSQAHTELTLNMSNAMNIKLPPKADGFPSAQSYVDSQPPVRQHPSSKQLFIGFMQLGLMGFGGVLPLAHRIIVDEKKWLSSENFIDLLGICQILPGGNIINMAVAIGMHFQGYRGALYAVLGLISAPTLIVVMLYQSYAYFQHIVWVQHMIQGLAAAAAGLLFATGIQMLKPIMRQISTWLTLGLAVLLMLLLKLPLLLTLLLLLAFNFCLLLRQHNSIRKD